MIRIFYILLLVISSFATQDYLYDYVDDRGVQLSLGEQRKFFKEYDGLNIIEEHITLGEYKEAISKSRQLKSETTNKLIQSKAVLLQYRAILNQDKLKFIIQNEKRFIEDIENNQISEPDLPEAYMMYIDYLIKLNKYKKAKMYASKIIDTYSYPLYQEYGFIYIAKVYIEEGKINQAQVVLNKVLRTTKNVKIASLAAGIQFDIFIKQDKLLKAKSMIENVVKFNITFFANNPNLANDKLEILLKHHMYDVVIDIAKILLKENKNYKMVPSYLYKLATAQLLTLDLKSAKENFIKVMHNHRKSKYANKAKIGVDEILLREGKLNPISLASRYKDSPTMQQKILLQELINLKKNKKYKLILQQQKIYKKIVPSIIKSYGLDSIESILNNVRRLLVKQYLNNDRCKELALFLQDNNNIFEELINQPKLEDKFLTCFSKTKYQDGFDYLYDKYKDTKNENLIYLLEKSAIQIGDYLKAFKLSLKLEKFGSKKLRQQEIIDRFLIINNIELLKAKDDFFHYLSNNMWLIESTQDPMIIDILYQYYHFLENRQSSKNKSLHILHRLYETQNKLNTYVYSPFVEIELSTIEYETKNYKKAKELLEDVELKNSTKAKKVHRYHYLKSKIFKKLEMDIEFMESIDSCIKSNGDSMWKELCKKVEVIDARN